MVLIDDLEDYETEDLPIDSEEQTEEPDYSQVHFIMKGRAGTDKLKRKNQRALRAIWKAYKTRRRPEQLALFCEV